MSRCSTQSLTRFRRPALAAALLASGLLAATLAGGPAAAQVKGAAPSAAAAPRAWGVAQRIPGLDAIAVMLSGGASGGGVDLNAVSCSAPGECTAGGDVSDVGTSSQGTEYGWVATESGGAWHVPRLIKIADQIGFAVRAVEVTSISCASPGNCTAVGSNTEAVEDTGFVDTYGAFVIDEVKGVWGKPEQIPGTDALNKGGYAEASSVSCPGPGNCAVTGVVRGGAEFVDSERGGTWGTAELVPGYRSAAGSADEEIFPDLLPVISCPRPGECTVAGDDTTGAGAEVTSVATEASGIWGTAVPLPGFAAAGGAVTSLSCRSAGNCSAGGWTRSGKAEVPFVASQSGGTWTTSAVPGYAKLTSFSAVDGPAVTAISCAAPGNCTAGGRYLAAAQRVGVFSVSEVGGVWRAAQKIPGTGVVPRSSSLTPVPQGISVPGISCPAAGGCAAVIDDDHAGIGYVATAAGGTWSPARRIFGATSGGVVSAVSCGAPGQCVAGGSDHPGGDFAYPEETEAWVLSGSSAAPTLTTASPSAAKVAYGKETAEKITVTVTATTPYPAGKVAVTANGKAVCTVTLKNGTGSCKLTARQLKAGPYQVVAKYRGAVPYAASSSAAKTVKVDG